MQRLAATHCIEVWIDPTDGEICNEPVFLIGYLEEALRVTTRLKFETIAIFKIKFKDNAEPKKAF